MSVLYTYKTEQMMKYNRNFHIFSSLGNEKELAHTHDFIEIVYILSGEMCHTVDGRDYQLRHGDILFMNYGCSHSFTSIPDTTYVNVLFSPDMIADGMINAENAFSILSLGAFNEMRSNEQSGKISFFGKERDALESIILSMLDEYNKKDSHWETVIGNYLSTFFIMLLRKSEQGLKPQELYNTWHELAEYIDSHLGERLTLSALAQKCFYNPSYFSRVFKEKFGMSLTEYITRKRLDSAIKLISTTSLSIEEVSTRSGFADRSSCTHAFTKYLGSLPSDYRKK